QNPVEQRRHGYPPRPHRVHEWGHRVRCSRAERPPGSNFLGFAFRGVDAQTHDAVYFRPFNFRANEAERKRHAAQYVCHPQHRWQGLREDKPGQYEKPILPAPDGDAWFHVRIVVEKPKVSVYVNDGKEPSLVVEELSDRKGGGVGLWVGPGQGGY